MKRGAIGLAAALCALYFAIPAWGKGTMDLKLVDLSDRDAVVVTVDGEALVSDLVVHKLRPSRLEALYRYSGDLPALGEMSGDLIQGVAIIPRQQGFMLTLTLSESLPVDGEQIYRESVLGSGESVLEVFAPGSARTPFKPQWLEGGGAVPVGNEPTPSQPPALVADASGAVPVKSSGGVSGVSFDPSTLTLTVRGAGESKYEVTKQQFPPRVDVLLSSAPQDPSLLGLVHKDLAASVTLVEVVQAKGQPGVVVRASLAPQVGLIGQTVRGDDLVLSFGRPAAASIAPRATPPQPALSIPAQAVADPPRATPVPSPASAYAPPATPIAPSAAPLSVSDAMSSAVGGGDYAQVAPPTGVGGQPQQVPSVEQILQMARSDAARYGENARDKQDKYGSYQLPPFAGAEGQLSDVRVNLSGMNGYSLYQFLMFLSAISGISIIIDPYWVTAPIGGWVRQPLDPGVPPGGQQGGQGFRGAGIFDPQLGMTGGTIMGNFDNMPFDQALDMVLDIHNLKKVVYRNPNDPYSKPVILVTSKERLEQEIAGQNEIDLYQLHYADPTQIYQILYQLNLLPSVTVGWYVYYGNNGGGQGGGNQGGNQGGGNQGGGQGGGQGGRGYSAPAPADAAATGGAVRSNYFDPLQIQGPTPTQAPGGGAGGGGGGGGQGGGGQGGGGQGGGQGGQGGQGGGGVPLPTAKSGLVVMRGTRQTLDTVQALIAKIDKPPKQVALKVKVFQVSDNPQDVWGLLRATAQKDRINMAYELGSLATNILPKGGVMLDENYTAAFEFLQQQRKAQLVTETEVAVVDGFNATITNTRTRGQLSGTLVITPDGQVINQPVWNAVTVGTTLNFTPQIDDRGRVTLSVTISLSNFDGPEQVASANGQQVTYQPTVTTNLTTVLRNVDGQTALIGGLTTSEDSVQFTGIPFISKLPIIGPFFGRTQRSRNESHIFVTIQVNIIDDK